MSTLKSNNENMTINADGASSEIILQQNATERMRIDSSGNVGIGVTPETSHSNSKTLQLGTGASIIGRTSGSKEDAYFCSNVYRNSSDVESYIIGQQASQIGMYNGQHLFKVASSGTAGNAISWTTAMTVQNDGSLLVGTTDGGSSGAGDIVANAIFLGGNQAANTLDDYEEGTFTPAFVGGTLTIASIPTAQYTKIGNTVHVNCHLELNNDGNSTVVLISGLPFTANSYSVGAINCGSGAIDERHHIRMNTGSTSFRVYIKRGSTRSVQTDIDGSHFMFSLTYHV